MAAVPHRSTQTTSGAQTGGAFRNRLQSAAAKSKACPAAGPPQLGGPAPSSMLPASHTRVTSERRKPVNGSEPSGQSRSNNGKPLNEVATTGQRAPRLTLLMPRKLQAAGLLLDLSSKSKSCRRVVPLRLSIPGSSDAQPPTGNSSMHRGSMPFRVIASLFLSAPLQQKGLRPTGAPASLLLAAMRGVHATGVSVGVSPSHLQSSIGGIPGDSVEVALVLVG